MRLPPRFICAPSLHGSPVLVFFLLPMKKLLERNGDIQVKSITSKEKVEVKKRVLPAGGQTS